MGTNSSKCVSLMDLDAAYFTDTYTVIRTSGEQQTGWQIANDDHRCFNKQPGAWRPRAHAVLQEDGWRVNMHNGHHTDADGERLDTHACGWRRLGSFWPTRLTGDQPAIDAWSNTLRDIMEQLASEQGLPDVWSKHTCDRGAPPDYCSGCCANMRAKTKSDLLAERKAGPTAERLVEIEAALAKIPTAAQDRAWKAWRSVADKLEEAQEDLRYDPSVELEEKIAILQRQAEELHAAAFPHEPLLEVRPSTPPPAAPEVLMPPPAAGSSAADELDAALDALGAKPYHPIYAPLTATKPLPDPMDAAAREWLLGRMQTPEKPEMHGCAYADSDCPWSICYACEYEKNPAQYQRSIRHSQLIQIISAYWRSPAVGEKAKRWDNELLEDVVAELDRPRAERMFSDAEISEMRIRREDHPWKDNILFALRTLHGVL